MKNTFKKIAASIMAVVSLVVGMTGIVSNAATPVSLSGTEYGTLTGSITVSGSTNVVFKTSTTKTAYKLVVTGDVDNYKTGALIKSTGKSSKNNTSSYSGKISWSFILGVQVSAFGAHEAYTSSDQGWVVYTSKTNFTI